MNRRNLAFTFIEMMVVVGLVLLCLTMLYQFWVTSTRISVDLEARITALRAAQLGASQLAQEVRMARRILYPAPGTADAAGVSVIAGDGTPLLFGCEPPAAGARAGRLYRVDLNTGARRFLATGVLALHCRVPAIPTGRDPDQVHVTLVMEGPQGKPLYLVSSARPLGLDVTCPTNR